MKILLRHNCVILLMLAIAAPAHSSEARLPKNRNKENAAQQSVNITNLPQNPGGDNAAMQIAIQSAMGSMSSDLMSDLAACLEKHVDPETANRIGGGAMGGQGGEAQQFLNSPTGKTVLANCQKQFQALLPQVQQQYQQDLSKKSTNTVPPAR